MPRSCAFTPGCAHDRRGPAPPALERPCAGRLGRDRRDAPRAARIGLRLDRRCPGAPEERRGGAARPGDPLRLRPPEHPRTRGRALLRPVPRRAPRLHAVERNRRLAAAVFGYTLDGPRDYGLAAPASRRPGRRPASTWWCCTPRAARDKRWPDDRWIALATRLHADGIAVVCRAARTPSAPMRRASPRHRRERSPRPR